MSVLPVIPRADLPHEARAGRTDPPCDFSAFVAQRRDIDRTAAERLIEVWFGHYRPRPRARMAMPSEEHVAAAAADYDSCA